MKRHRDFQTRLLVLSEGRSARIVLVCNRGRTGQPYRSPHRVGWIRIRHPESIRRREELHRGWQNGRRVRVRSLPGGISLARRHDVDCERERSRLRERSRFGYREVGKCQDRPQSGPDLASSRLRDEPRAVRIGMHHLEYRKEISQSWRRI